MLQAAQLANLGEAECDLGRWRAFAVQNVGHAGLEIDWGCLGIAEPLSLQHRGRMRPDLGVVGPHVHVDNAGACWG